jgi:uncharacterized membrane protein YfcA
MTYLLGFGIALTIGLTGVGGGTLTVPLLVLFLGVPASTAVGSALAFSAAVKVPACIVYLQRKEVSFKILGWLLLGGAPGVLTGSLLLNRLAGSGLQGAILAVVGLTLTVIASVNLFRLVWGRTRMEAPRERLGLLPICALPIGAEVGFSSAGAGALGTLVLLQFTALAPSAVVGTDLLFGFIVSTIGGGLHVSMGNFDKDLLFRLILGGLPGAFLGARLAGVLPGRTLRGVLLAWLVYLGSLLAYRGLHAVML